MKTAEFIFCGNRAFVLEEMLKLNLHVKKICAVKGSYLEQFLISKGIRHIVIKDKMQLIKILEEEQFDYFISNGCPFIIPVSKLKNNRKIFINIHPSYLPDLRGADPQPAALLFGRDSGATCHLMSDKIDSGDIISQVKIKYSGEYDVNLLYQLTFRAEQKVFIDAYKRNFKPVKKQVVGRNHLYYTFSIEDLKIDFNSSALKIHRTVQAFSNPNKGARFSHKNNEFKVFNSSIVRDNFVKNFYKNSNNNEVVLKYNSSIGLKKNNELLVLKNIEGDLSKISVGEILI